MRTLTIEAKSRDSADRFYAAVKEFDPELIETESGEFAVRIALDTERDVVAVLNALVDHMNERAEGSAVVALDDRRHMLNAS
jgi:hypothetical protein